MRKIERIVVHCTAGSPGAKAREIVNWQMRPREKGGRGWRRPGYHFIVEADGRVVKTWPIDDVSNGVAGHNKGAIHVCYTGGVDMSKPTLPPMDTRTAAQKQSLITLLRKLHRLFPNAEILGHRDLAPKACPSFNARKEYGWI